MDWVRSHKHFSEEEMSLMQLFAEMLTNVSNRLTAIKELDKANAELLRKEERYQSLIESSDSAIVMYDAKGNVLYLNHIAAMSYDKKTEDLVGKNVRELFSKKRIRKYIG